MLCFHPVLWFESKSKPRGYLGVSPAYTCNRPGELLGKSSYLLPTWCVTPKSELHRKLCESLFSFFGPVLGARLCRGGEDRLGSVGVLKRRPQETVLQRQGLARGPVLPDVVITVLLHLYQKERTFA